MLDVVKISVSLLPVFAFLITLIFLDSYKLLKVRSILIAIGIGGLVAVLCLILNVFLLSTLQINLPDFRRYLAPVLEESLKAVYLVYLLRTRRIGFMVDAAIFGFSIGAGFAAVENIQYLYALENSSLLLWIIRGFGTAIMHGGTTALVGIVSKNVLDRRQKEKFYHILPPLGIAIVIHSAFNHFLLNPLLSTMLILVILPLIFIAVFEQSEKSLKKWLDVGFVSDVELLQMIRSGSVLESRIGQYLVSLKNKVPGEVLVDMLCYLQISVELALKAKGTLLMHEAGFDAVLDEEAKSKLKELKQLEHHIGKTGKRILAPFLHVKSQDLWQIHMLEKHSLSNSKPAILRKHRK
jgi:RsiW-degrading membrane proteinase PrsW (M82 family)